MNPGFLKTIIYSNNTVELYKKFWEQRIQSDYNNSTKSDENKRVWKRFANEEKL